MTAKRPWVVVHVAVSLDGAATGFDPDVGRFYELAATWSEDVTLAGADTILTQEAALAGAPRPGPTEGGPLLAVVDSRRRVTAWDALRECGHWSDVVALRAASGQPPEAHGPREIGAGQGRVDLEAALVALGAEGRAVVRVDSGGGLNGALLTGRLVDEVSLLVHPVLAGSGRRWTGDAAAPAPLEAIGAEELEGGLLWLRYRVRP